MESCPTEVTTLILEHACRYDFGKTARQVGLVSKYFRSIAEPIEIRTISVAGLKQLRGAIARIESARRSRAMDSGNFGTGVQHLFISELKKEHAVAADADFEYAYSGLRSRFLGTPEGKEAKAFYLEYTDELWRLATELVKDSAESLKTLFLLACNSWVGWRREARYDTRVHGKVLGVLNGLSLPRLTRLTVDHDVGMELRCFDNDSIHFGSPSMPCLRKLRIISWEFSHVDLLPSRRIHPLLEGLYARSAGLTHLTVCCPILDAVSDVMKHAFFEEWQEILENGTLPGALQSVVVQQGFMPNLSSRSGYIEYFQSVQVMQQMVKDLRIDGLTGELPAMVRFKTTKKKFEQLYGDWEEQSLSGFH